MNMKVKVSGRGQICLPAVFRKRFKIAAGDVLEVLESGGSLVLCPLRRKRTEKKRPLCLSGRLAPGST